MDKMERRWRKIDEAAGRGRVDIGDIVARLTREEMLQAIGDMLSIVDYKMVPAASAGEAVPDFRARREEDGTGHEVVGVLCMAAEEMAGCYERLVELQKALGDTVEYAIAVHQMPEYLLYDMLEADRGKLYIAMKERMYMMWVCYKSEEGTRVWCFLGGSRDKMLEARFAMLRQLTAEAIVGPRVTDMLMEEEAEEF